MTKKFEKQPNSELDLRLIERLTLLMEKNEYKNYLEVLDKALEKVVTQECGEKMLYLPKHLPKTIFLNPSEKDSKYQMFYLREGVVEKLKYIQKKLPKGYHLWLANTTRTEKIVMELYNIYIERFKKENPKLNDKQVDLKVRNILAMPGDLIPPGHMTGGAVDVLLANSEGERLPMKIDKKKVPNEVQSFTFYPDLPKELKKNRMLLYNSMLDAGFHNYAREFWHYSHGDAYWAVRRKKKMAIYGIPPKKLFEKRGQ